jgi:hypothetical protein
MAVYRIAAVRTEFHLIEMVVRAHSQDEAERSFEYAFDDHGKHVLGWTEDPGGSETEIESIALLPRDHDPVPSDADRTLCRYCGRPFYWTGTSAERSPTGASIPGPWTHVERPLITEGLGL